MTDDEREERRASHGKAGSNGVGREGADNGSSHAVENDGGKLARTKLHGLERDGDGTDTRTGRTSEAAGEMGAHFNEAAFDGSGQEPKNARRETEQRERRAHDLAYPAYDPQDLPDGSRGDIVAYERDLEGGSKPAVDGKRGTERRTDEHDQARSDGTPKAEPSARAPRDSDPDPFANVEATFYRQEVLRAARDPERQPIQAPLERRHRQPEKPKDPPNPDPFAKIEEAFVRQEVRRAQRGSPSSQPTDPAKVDDGKVELRAEFAKAREGLVEARHSPKAIPPKARLEQFHLAFMPKGGMRHSAHRKVRQEMIRQEIREKFAKQKAGRLRSTDLTTRFNDQGRSR